MNPKMCECLGLTLLRGNTSKAREQIEAARRIFVGKTGLFDESLKAVGFNF
jgi:hypothetical protein